MSLGYGQDKLERRTELPERQLTRETSDDEATLPHEEPIRPLKGLTSLFGPLGRDSLKSDQEVAPQNEPPHKLGPSGTVGPLLDHRHPC